MRTIACVDPGIIVDGTLLKSGKISEKNRRDVTKECIIAVMQLISCTENFLNDGGAGFSWEKNDGSGKYQLILYDTDKYTLMPNGATEN